MVRSVSRFRIHLAFVAVLATAATAIAAKRPLTHADYDSWRSIGATSVSRDGRWLAYGYHPQDGDGEVIVRDLRSGREFKHGVGTLPPPPLPDPTSETPPAPRAIKLAFTSDGKWLVSTTYPTKAETEAAKKAKKKPEEMPQTGLLLVNLSNGEAQHVANVKSVQVPEKGGAWAAWLSTPTPGANKDDGTELTLRNLATGTDRKFALVTEYGIARDGGALWFASNSKEKDASKETNGAFVVKPGTEGEPVALVTGKAKFNKAAADRANKRLVFFRTPDGKGAKTDIYLYDFGASGASRLEGIVPPGGMQISEKGSLSFTRNGESLLIPVAAPKAEAEKKDEAPSNERVLLDLWHYRDPLVQPMQRVRATQDRNRTYRGIWHIAEKRYVQLADETMRTVTTDDAATIALTPDLRPYERMSDYDTTYSDVYVVNPKTGDRRKALEKMRGQTGGVTLSPDGKWGLFYRDKQWHALDTQTLAVKPLTAQLGVAFHDEDDDTPDEPGSYGNAGWLKDSASVLLYDRYDVWRVFVNGSAAVNLTRGEGRKAKTVYRVARIEPRDDDDDDARYLDPAKPLYLRAENEETFATGFFEQSFSATAAPKKLLWGDRNYSFAARAADADIVVLKAENFNEYPDLHVTDISMKKLTKASNGTAQMEPVLWGSSELMTFRNADGVPLQAALFKPANFDAKKKYPLIVYIYERLSNTVHTFTAPAPSHNINTSLYTSNGYVVMRPDIVYSDGRPGQSALKCVLPAIAELVKRGFIDESNIGIQGHSWGGYQIAYMVTQTRLFKAAEAGAPVGNMTSAYSGIRWGTGMPRQFQYEKTQSRIGEPLVNAPLKYIENSPVFFADRVTTPLLILHNDNDDAVPWYQGIELFLALRRQNKEAYLLNYNNEFHGLRRRWNQRDYAIRMMQFFDHHLKGAPAPEWMQKGVPFIEREEEKVRFQQSLATDPQ